MKDVASKVETPPPQQRDTPRGERVLVVDDEPVVTEVVERYLRREGFEVSIARDGSEALQAVSDWSPDLVILDLMLPTIGGVEVCRQLRRDSDVPIVMLTAKGEESDRVVGLELGADDYVAKPFSPRELVARVKSVLRRTSSSFAQSSGVSLRFGAMTINPQTRTVTVRGDDRQVTAKEFDLLLFLARHPGQVFNREQLMDSVWDYTYASDASTVTVHVRRLREKVEADPVRPQYIKTVWGVGYKFEP